MKNRVINKYIAFKPKVSIIMSAHNADKFLKEAVQSILNQSYKNFEFIIVNDGSTDHTFEILNSFSRADKRIKVINQENKGLTKSLIGAASISNGEYIARMDADDISDINRISKQIDYLDSNENVGMLGSWIKIIDSEDKITKNIKLPTRISTIKRRIKYGNQFVHGSSIFRKDIYKEVGGYDESFRFSQDYDLWLRMIKITDCVNINEYLYYLRVHENSISVKNKQLQLENAVRCITKNIYKKKDYLSIDDLTVNKVSARLLLRRGEYEDARFFYNKIQNIEGFIMSIILKHRQVTSFIKRIYIFVRSIIDWKK